MNFNLFFRLAQGWPQVVPGVPAVFRGFTSFVVVFTTSKCTLLARIKCSTNVFASFPRAPSPMRQWYVTFLTCLWVAARTLLASHPTSKCVTLQLPDEAGRTVLDSTVICDDCISKVDRRVTFADQTGATFVVERWTQTSSNAPFTAL